MRRGNSMSSRSAAKKMRPPPKTAAKVAKAPAKPKARKLAKVTKFPKVGKHADKKPARKPPPARPAAKAPPPRPVVKKPLPPLPALTPPKQVQPPKRSEEHTSELQ